MPTDFDLIVVGGGAAGIFGAICAAEALEAPTTHRILVAEKSQHWMSKVLISGGGRCNVTHACFEPEKLINYYPNGGIELLGPFHSFQPSHMMAWLEQNGVSLKTEADGRVFPRSNQSRSVVDCFLSKAQQLGIELRLLHGVRKIDKPETSRPVFRVHFSNGNILTTKLLLLSPGGGIPSAYIIAQEMGHKIIKPIPSLFSFEIRDPRLEGLAGISIPSVTVKLTGLSRKHLQRSITESQGPVLITHKGLSGPAILKLSAWAARLLAENGYHATLQVNWLPDYDPVSFYNVLFKHRSTLKQVKSVTTAPVSQLPPRLWKKLVIAALEHINSGNRTNNLPVWQNVPNQFLQALASLVTQSEFQIIGRNQNKDEFVTSGGIARNEVDFRTMESKLVSGLFFAGEYLDIDGLTGGFNFQAAWTTGWLAGRTIAGRLRNIQSTENQQP